MVDMTNFHHWCGDVAALAETLKTELKTHLAARPDTQFEVVVPAFLLAAYELAEVQGQRLGISDDAVSINFFKQCQLTPLVSAERNKAGRENPQPPAETMP